MFDKGDCDFCDKKWIGDGFCDKSCNNSKYNFDEGDCYLEC